MSVQESEEYRRREALISYFKGHAQQHRMRAAEFEELVDKLVSKNRELREAEETDIKYCRATRDGECDHPLCPQNRDNEPLATGRSCPAPSLPEEG